MRGLLKEEEEDIFGSLLLGKEHTCGAARSAPDY